MNIFLSYSSADRDLADRVRLALVSQKHHVFFDRNGLTPGLEYDTCIAKAIEQADLFVFLISPESITPGRYTLTELSIAQRKWSHPEAHVLPVMVRATPIEHIPPYLKAVTILMPAGDIPADVAREIRRRKTRWPRPLRAAIGGLATLAVASLLFGFFGFETHARQATELLQAARSFQAAEDYASAWTTIQEARAHVTESPLNSLLQRTLTSDVSSQQADIAVAWLDNMHLHEGQSFSDVVNQLLPALDEAIRGTGGERKADLLAHRGWADFLRSRYNAQEFSPEPYYRRALEVDSTNVYAHTMWGHWIMWQHGKLAEAREHFNAALASGRQRPYVREMQLASMKNSNNDDADAEMVCVAHDMVSLKEPFTAEEQSGIASIYYFVCRRARTGSMEKLTNSLPPKDHVTLLRGLFFNPDQDHSPNISELCLAMLEEQGGLRADALKRYRALQTNLTPRDPDWPLTKAAIARLSLMN